MASGKVTSNVRTLYNDTTATYRNVINTNITLNDSVDNYSALEVLMYVGSISSSTRVLAIIPAYTGAVYTPAALGTTIGYVRCQASGGTAFSLLSSTWSSVWIEWIKGIR